MKRKQTDAGKECYANIHDDDDCLDGANDDWICEELETVLNGREGGGLSKRIEDALDEDRQEDRHGAEIRQCYCLQDVSMLHNSVLLEMLSDIELYKENDRFQLLWSELNDKTKFQLEIKLVGNKGCSLHMEYNRE